MPIVHRVNNGKGIEIKTVSLGHAISAIGLTLTLLFPVIGFLWGARYNEQTISTRLVKLEKDQALMTQGLQDVISAFRNHETWSAARSAQMDELKIELRLLRQRQNFYHPGTNE